MARPAPWRHLRPAWELDVLLSPGDLSAGQPGADVDLLGLRPPVLSRALSVRRSLIVPVLSALVVLAWWPAAADAVGTIRVALVESARSAELQGTDIELRRLPDTNVGAWRTTLVRAVWTGSAIEIDGRKAPAFRLRSNRPIRMNGREYGTPIDLVQYGAGFAVVNELPLEEYLVGVLRGEASDVWPSEALRAQAIVARTYGAYHRLLGAGRPFHIVASTANQQF